MNRILPEAAEPSSVSWNLPAPIGGWNAKDAIAQMPALDALQLDNWFPNTTTVDTRPGKKTFATLPVGQAIQSLMAVAKFDGTYKRFAASQGGIYDVTAGGAISAVSSAASTGIWQSTQINVAGVSYLWCCAGDTVNKSRIFNSTTGAWTLLDGSSTPALTGPTSENIANVSLWKYRLILTERNSLKFWYGPLNSVGGAFSAFDLGQVFKKGGYLVATYNWTLDAGNGPDDRFVAITSEGEVAIYQGTDPSNAATFSLIGVYSIGKPASRRCFSEFAGDLVVLTEQGLWPLSRALLSSTIDLRQALTDKIQAAFNSYFKTYGATFGWTPVLLPKGPALIVNVPLSIRLSYQFVMNLNTGAWCRFKGWEATCMSVSEGRLFFAMENKVFEGWTGTNDDGNAITAVAAQAYGYGPSRTKGKKVKMRLP